MLTLNFEIPLYRQMLTMKIICFHSFMINYSLYWLNCKFIEIIDLGYRLGEIMMLSHLFLSQLFGIFADQKKKKKIQ